MPLVKIIPPDPNKPFVMPLMDVSAISRKFIDIDYTPKNPHPARLLDIYLPEPESNSLEEKSSSPYPTIICIHGGGFSGGSKNDFQVAAFLEGLEYGFAVVSVEQRLCTPQPDGTYSPEGVFPNPLCDFKAAIRFLRANAEKYSLDPNRFALCGGSAGGYHAIMAALTHDVPALYDYSLGFAEVSGKVDAVVDWYGVSDFVLLSEATDATPPMKLPDGTVFNRPNHADVFLGIKCQEHPNLARLANPEAWVSADAPPVLLQAGTADEMVPVESSRRLAKRIEEICGKQRVTFDEFPDYTHGDMRFNDPANLKRVFEWLTDKLSKKGEQV